MTERSFLILACAHLFLKKLRLKKNNKEADYNELQRVIAVADAPGSSLRKALMLKLRS